MQRIWINTFFDLIASIASSTATVSLDAAIKTAEDALDGRFNDHPATLEYFVGADGAVALTHVMQIKNEAAGTWFQAFVNAHSGELVSIVDFVTKASVNPFISVTREICWEPVSGVSCSSRSKRTSHSRVWNSYGPDRHNCFSFRMALHRWYQHNVSMDLLSSDH